MVVTLSCLARSTAQRLGIPEPQIKRAREHPYREHDTPEFVLAFVEVGGHELVLRCRHDDPGQIVSLGEA
ncbi:MAG: hypothetical protein QOJ29_3685 [Thermoleophilaceae bacterium]|jgi:hypothetical protein|nr:hypothetical protein [Thermoleophilaceae bacterium]